MAETVPAWRRIPERGTRTSARIVIRLAQMAPGWVAYPVVWLLSLYFTAVPSRSVRDANIRYLTRALERRPGFRDRWRLTANFAKVVYERVGLLSRGTRGFAVRAQGETVIEDLHRAGRGAVLLGAHFGSFEAMRAFDRSLPGLKVRYLMFEENAAQTADLFASINPEVARQIIPASNGPAAMLAARECLEAGEFVAFLGDRTPDPTPRGLVEARFLGAPVHLPRAPYLCAMLARAPLVLCFAPRTGPRAYEITFRQIHDGAAVGRDAREALCRDLAQDYADALSDLCRHHPYNWFNFHDVWSDT